MKILIEMKLKEEERVQAFKIVRAMSYHLEELGDAESFQMVIKEDDGC